MNRQNNFHEGADKSFEQYEDPENIPEMENPEYEETLAKLSRGVKAEAKSLLDSYENALDEEKEAPVKEAPACALHKKERDEQRRRAKVFSRFEISNIPRIYNDVRYYLPQFLKRSDGTQTNISEISLKEPEPMLTVKGVSWWNFLSETVKWCFPKVNYNPIMYADIIIEEVVKPLYYCEDPLEARNCINLKRLKERMVEKMKTEELTD
jgi:hypothetical protein